MLSLSFHLSFSHNFFCCFLCFSSFFHSLFWIQWIEWYVLHPVCPVYAIILLSPGIAIIKRWDKCDIIKWKKERNVEKSEHGQGSTAYTQNKEAVFHVAAFVCYAKNRKWERKTVKSDKRAVKFKRANVRYINEQLHTAHSYTQGPNLKWDFPFRYKICIRFDVYIYILTYIHHRVGTSFSPINTENHQKLYYLLCIEST